MNSWSDTLTLPKPLRQVRLKGGNDAEDELRASYEQGRRDAEQALSEQLVRQRTEVQELIRGTLD